MIKRLSGGQKLDELESTARNTYANAGSVDQFDFTDFYQSDKSKVSFPCLSFLPRAHAASSSIFIFSESLFSIRSHQSSPLVLPSEEWRSLLLEIIAHVAVSALCSRLIFRVYRCLEVILSY